MSSNGSAPVRPGLQRRDSSGSMTERTFREPSPSRIERPASSHGPYPKYDKDDAPPVPALPQRYSSPSPMGPSSGARSASVETRPTRGPATGAVKLHRTSASVLSTPAGKQPSSELGLNSAAHMAATKANVRSSINFSRPMSPQSSPTSPPPSSSLQRPKDDTMNSFKAPPQPVSNSGSVQKDPSTPNKRKKKKAPSEQLPAKGIAAEQKPNLQATEDISRDSQDTKSDSMNPTARPVSARVVERESGQIPSSSSNLQVVEKRKKPKKKKKPASTSSIVATESNDNFGNAYPSDTDSAVSDISSTTDQGRSVGPRAKGALAKQPSIVREDPEAEARDEIRYGIGKSTSASRGDHGPQEASKIDQNVKIWKARGKTGGPHKLEVGNTPQGSSGKPEPVSLSPARAAHFSAQPVHESPIALKHQPLGRSASPAKSAMKQSPSRGASPSLLRTKGLTPGEASDTGSGLSDDGRRSQTKRKSARVSFDDGSVVIGQAASPVAGDSPVLLSPQDNKTKQSLKQKRDKDLGRSESDQDDDETAISPTPALPSFGSIRGRKTAGSRSKDEEHQAENHARTGGLTGAASSTDQNVGVALSSHEKAYKANAPAPETPDVTSVESDATASRVSYGKEPMQDHRGTPLSTSDQSNEQDIAGHGNTALEKPQQRAENEDDALAVPSIAILPATPGADGNKDKHDEWLEMPGGYPGAAGTVSKETNPQQGSEGASNVNVPAMSGQQAITTSNEEAVDNLSGRSSPVITPASAGIAEPELGVVAAQHELGAPHVGDVADAIRTQIDAQEHDQVADEGSLYSDAAEEHTEPDGDGFGSINAIVESPALRPSPSAEDLPPPGEEDQLHSGPDIGQGEVLDDTQQSSRSLLSSSRRLQLEQAAVPGAADEPVLRDRTLRGKDSVARKPKKNPPKQTKPAPALPKSTTKVNHPPSQTSRLENSGLPSSSPKKLDQSKRQIAQSQSPAAEPKGVLQKKSRPASTTVAQEASAPRPANKTKLSGVSSGNPSLASSGAPANAQKKGAKPRLDRTKSNGSESDSSFKRSRISGPSTGRYQMKRTMRGSYNDATPSPAQSRPLSTPAGSAALNQGGRRPFSSTGPGGAGMRMSMRDPIDPGKSNRRSLRLSMDSSRSGRTKSPSRISFGLGHKKAPTKAGPSYASRFGDSSDEEDAIPAMKSRFEDSSDDEPAQLAPVRGIPRQIDEGDSTELEDSSVDDARVPTSGKSNDTQPTTVSTPSSKIGPNARSTGKATANDTGPPAEAMSALSMSTGEKEKKKRFYFGTFRGKKKGDPSKHQASEDLSQPAEPAHQTEVSASPKTPTTETAADLTASGINPDMDAKTVQPTAKPPRLQRRFTPKSFNKAKDTSWPLTADQSTQEASIKRPQTSDGPSSATTTERPEVGNRRVTMQNAPEPGAIENEGKKKKRFPMLRKAFGLSK